VANSAQARKRARQAVKHRAHNMALRSRMRTFIKRTRATIAAGDKEKAQEAFHQAQSVLDSSVGKGLIHANKAARLKSRLSAQIKSL